MKSSIHTIVFLMMIVGCRTIEPLVESCRPPIEGRVVRVIIDQQIRTNETMLSWRLYDRASSLTGDADVKRIRFTYHDNTNSWYSYKDYGGVSVDKPIVINAWNEFIGDAAELNLISRLFPDYSVYSDYIIEQEDKAFRILSLKKSDGSLHEVYIDRSYYHGLF